MPPRFAYWTIILDGTPTSFRTKEREEILPLFNQLKAKNPGALLKWFSGGKLWDSPEQAREVRELEKVRRFREKRAHDKTQEQEWSPGSAQPGERRGARGEHRPWSPRSSDPGAQDPLAEFRRQHGRPADGSDDRSLRPGPSTRPQQLTRPWSPGSSDPGSPKAPRGDRQGAPKPDRRGKDWRPGGEHKDPRDKYKLPPGEARKRWKERNLRGPASAGGRAPKPFGPKPFGTKPFGGKPFGSKPGGPRKSGGPSTRDGGDRSLRAGKPFGDRPRGPRPPGGSRGKR